MGFPFFYTRMVPMQVSPSFRRGPIICHPEFSLPYTCYRSKMVEGEDFRLINAKISEGFSHRGMMKHDGDEHMGDASSIVHFFVSLVGFVRGVGLQFRHRPYIRGTIISCFRMTCVILAALFGTQKIIFFCIIPLNGSIIGVSQIFFWKSSSKLKTCFY